VSRVILAANNGEIGGGEVMLLHSAVALRDLGYEPHVVGPDAIAGVVSEAVRLGFGTTALAASRRRYVLELRRWAAGRDEWLWCHGLVPSLATSGRSRRIVHLHQPPAPRYRAAARVARARAAATLVPSASMTAFVPGATVMWNWVDEVPTRPRPGIGRPARIGFIGRHSTDKGLDVLAEALEALERRAPGSFRLVLAGDDRFVPETQRDDVATALRRVRAQTDPVGWCDRADFFSLVDVAVFPSTWPEPFGLVVAEAMGARVPVVVSDAGALPEVVGSGHPWLARTGDADHLADVILACVGADTTTRDASVAAARRRWQAHFSPEAGRARVEALLEDLEVTRST
jgi:glycosyltransferase involved in cell wall biosynthesis